MTSPISLLIDHDDLLGFVVVLEQLQAVDEVHALDRVAADADAGRLTEAGTGGLEHRLVGQGAGAADDAGGATLVDVTRHDADLALARGDDAGAVGADQDAVAVGQGFFTAYMSLAGMPSVMQAISGMPAAMASRMASAANGGGTKIMLALAPPSATASATVFQTGTSRLAVGLSVQVLAALAWGDAADDRGAVVDSAVGVEGADLTGDTLGDEFGVIADENAHGIGFSSIRGVQLCCYGSRRRPWRPWRSHREVVGGDHIQTAFGDQLLAELDVGAFQADHQWHVEADFLHRSQHAFGDGVALHDAAEDVDQDRFDVVVLRISLKARCRPSRRSRRRRRRGSWPGRLPLGAVDGDGVHGRHGQPAPLTRQPMLPSSLTKAMSCFLASSSAGSSSLGRACRRCPVTEQGVVVEADFGVERDHLVVAGDDERVDLQHVGIGFDEGFGQRLGGLHEGADLLGGQAHFEAQQASAWSSSGQHGGS